MVDLVSINSGPFIEDISTSIDESRDFNFNNSILTSSENILKPKCSKGLKKKLKKYKLRKDGSEDPDVVNVSQSFQSFKLRSPIKHVNDNAKCSEFVGIVYPINYISKMVRKKQLLGEKCNNVEINNALEEKVETSESGNCISTESKDKIESNVFKIMMQSRNKSIGSNSPGKNTMSEQHSEDILSQKKIKIKRNLALQKLAEAKGSKKQKELEELREENIKIKMEARAEKFKDMLINTKKKQKPGQKKNRTNNNFGDQVSRQNINKKERKSDEKSKKECDVITKTNTFLSTLDETSPPKTKRLNLEDIEFLNKLSPSIKKKESMLSYFKKIDKEPEPDEEFFDENIDCEEQNLELNSIKVKLVRKDKKKKKKLSLNRSKGKIKTTEIIDLPKDNNVKDKVESQSRNNELQNENSDTVDKTRKRKRKCLDNAEKVTKVEDSEGISELDTRPKRNVKKPVKYTDDIVLSSSDEEIITPKKKKHNEKKFSLIPSAKELNSKKSNAPTAPTKLAPIFKAKTLIDPAVLEAKQKFLNSGTPDQIKKMIEHKKIQNDDLDYFCHVLHVQQQPTSKCDKITLQNINLLSDTDSNDLSFTFDKHNIFKLITVNNNQDLDMTISTPLSDPSKMLQKIKASYPQFPVFRTYKLLKSLSRGEGEMCNYVELDNSADIMNNLELARNDDTESLIWTEKYKANSSKHIIGNFEGIKELKKWLLTWKDNSANMKKENSDSDSDFWQFDTDSQEKKVTNNLLILSGPTGSGKTSSVYAIATELAIKVIEMNASRKRTGKILLQELLEATQSHKVNRGKGSSTENSQELYKTKKKKKRLSQKSNSQTTQEESTRGMSLILIDDADIVFDQDDGFTAGISQLVQCSKRPIVLTTTPSTCHHLQKFFHTSTVIKMKPLLPRMLGTWLDIMCLAETGICWPESGVKFLDYFHGDIRKTINSLQFYFLSESQKYKNKDTSNDTQLCDINSIEDENSSMSWVDKGQPDESQNCTSVHNDIWENFLINQNQVTKLQGQMFPLDVFNIWWVVPQILHTNPSESTCNKESSIKDLEQLSEVLDDISIVDSLNCLTKQDKNFAYCHPPWYSSEAESVSEREHSEDVDGALQQWQKLSHDFLVASLSKAKSVLDPQKHDVNLPGLIAQRQRNKVRARHDPLNNIFIPNSTLDRRALALDYWSCCRAICRTEKTKTDTNSRRNNRFFHYLKSLKVACKNDVLDKLCESLQTETA